MHLIMFDIDGTLVDSSGVDEECYLQAAESILGITISSNWGDYKDVTDSGILEELMSRYNIPGDKRRVRQRFRNEFYKRVSGYIRDNPGEIREIPGAASFFSFLSGLDNCRVAIATGGWEKTAKLKLKTAEIPYDTCAFASSSDHVSRTEIMKAAEARGSSENPFISKTYFGDAPWDKKASENLGYRFVSVGNRVKHKYRIRDFTERESLLEILGL